MKEPKELTTGTRSKIKNSVQTTKTAGMNFIKLAEGLLLMLSGGLTIYFVYKYRPVQVLGYLVIFCGIYTGVIGLIKFVKHLAQK